MRRPSFLALLAAAGLWLATAARAEIRVVAEHNPSEDATEEFKFKGVPSPAANDAATTARFSIVEGRRDTNGGGLDRLNDGRVPADEDEPSASFFFAAGSPGGRLLVDLGSRLEIKQICTYSWHSDTRAPQVYRLYAGDGAGGDFDPRPAKGTDPEKAGWKLVAKVDTRPERGEGGGQHGVRIYDPDGPIGDYRYLLLDVSRTESRDPFGNTFYSEIDVDDGKAREVARPPDAETHIKTFTTKGGTCRITIDTSETPDLTPWAHKELAPVVLEWYPKIVELLPSEGYKAPTRVGITFRKDMRGVAATAGTRIHCAPAWFRQQLQGEAKGAVVHELVHVVQQYGRARRTNPDAKRTPGWLVEGIADYIRWFLYEPQTRGAEITRRALPRARYDASYRTSGNFLNWVTGKHGRDVVRRLNAAAREGKVDEALWKQLTGHTVEELGEAWLADLKRRLDSPPPARPKERSDVVPQPQ